MEFPEYLFPGVVELTNVVHVKQLPCRTLDPKATPTGKTICGVCELPTWNGTSCASRWNSPVGCYLIERCHQSCGLSFVRRSLVRSRIAWFDRILRDGTLLSSNAVCSCDPWPLLKLSVFKRNAASYSSPEQCIIVDVEKIWGCCGVEVPCEAI